MKEGQWHLRRHFIPKAKERLKKKKINELPAFKKMKQEVHKSSIISPQGDLKVS